MCAHPPLIESRWSRYGGYCVFAQVADGDDASFKVIDAIAAAVKTQKSVAITSITYRAD